MTVGELKKSLEGVRDEIQVVLLHEKFCDPQAVEPYMYFVKDARFHPILKPNDRHIISSDEEFLLEAGEGFEY